jgi:hypothetical protein
MLSECCECAGLILAASGQMDSYISGGHGSSIKNPSWLSQLTRYWFIRTVRKTILQHTRWEMKLWFLEAENGSKSFQFFVPRELCAGYVGPPGCSRIHYFNFITISNISEKSAAVETGKLLRNITRKNILTLICQSEAFSAYLGPNLSQQLHYFSSLMKPGLQIFC